MKAQTGLDLQICGFKDKYFVNKEAEKKLRFIIYIVLQNHGPIKYNKKNSYVLNNTIIMKCAKKYVPKNKCYLYT